jgi:hypothetical protein
LLLLQDYLDFYQGEVIKQVFDMLFLFEEEEYQNQRQEVHMDQIL